MGLFQRFSFYGSLVPSQSDGERARGGGGGTRDGRLTGGVRPPRVALLPRQRSAHGVGRADPVRISNQVLGVHRPILRPRYRLQFLFGLVDGVGLRGRAGHISVPP